MVSDIIEVNIKDGLTDEYYFKEKASLDSKSQMHKLRKLLREKGVAF